MLQRLLIVFAQVKTGSTSKNLLNNTIFVKKLLKEYITILLIQ